MWLRLFLFLFLSAQVFSQDTSTETGSLIDDTLTTLEDILKEAECWKNRVDSLQRIIGDLEKQIKTSETLSDELETLLVQQKSLLMTYQKRVDQLSKRYARLLLMSQSLKKSFVNERMIYIIGIPAALVVGITAGIILFKSK